MSFFSSDLKAQFYNGSQMKFGKNRLQYQEFFWNYYRYEKFDTYFYRGGNELAIYTSKTIENHIKEVETILDYSLENSLQIIVFNKQSEFKQSNIGLPVDEDYNVGGTTKIVGSKMIVYFEGDYAKFDRQIRAGVTEVILNEMMYGGNWREVLRSSTLLALPDWFTKGLISYMSEPWSTETENMVKDGVLSGRFSKINHLERDEAVMAGHAIWNYIAEVYGASVISNIVYLAQVSRNTESGFMFVLGISLKSLSDDFNNYYKNKYTANDRQKTLPDGKPIRKIKAKRDGVITKVALNPEGNKIAYVTNQLGKYKVFIYDVETNKRKRLLKVGHKMLRINDTSYPIIKWHPNGEILAILEEIEAKPVFTFHNIKEGEVVSKPVLRIEKVIDFSYSPDGRDMVLSAVNAGQSDIYHYRIAANNASKLTDDMFDDLNPVFLNNHQIVFSSNRNTLEAKPKDVTVKRYSHAKNLFMLDIKSKNLQLKKLTENNMNIQTKVFEGNNIIFLSDEEDSYNRYLLVQDSVISHIDTTTHYRYVNKSVLQTNFSRSILDYDISTPSKKVVDLVYKNNKYKVYLNDFKIIDPEEKEKIVGDSLSDKNDVVEIESIRLKDKKIKQANDALIYGVQQDTNEESVESNEQFVDINNYTFDFEDFETKKDSSNDKQDEKPSLSKQEKKLKQAKAKRPKIYEGENEENEDFVISERRNYNITFFTDYLVSQMDNNFMNEAYQRFTGGGPYFNPGLSGMFKVGIVDLFENKRITGGFRLGANLNSNEIMLSYEDLEDRWNKQYVFHRQSISLNQGFSLAKVQSYTLKQVMTYPINEVSAFKFTTSGRHDQFITSSTDLANLQENTIYEYWGSVKGEYIYDNTLPIAMNLREGSRMKIFAEHFRRLDNFREVDMTVLGLDARNYIRIHRDFIWANRLAASTSFGSERLIYYLGGVDNWLFPQYNDETPINQNQNYVYQALATNMRGFAQNTRNGNSFAVINSELRLPLFKYILDRPLKSDFMHNFQVIGFGDVGAAWTGRTPYSEDNTFNTNTIVANPITVRLFNQKEPIVGAFGFGVRSRIWGYFARLDFAWGIEDGIRQPMVVHLSLNLDF